MDISVNFLKKSVFVYLTVPFLLFAVFWVRPLIGIPAVAAVVWAVYSGVFKSVDADGKHTFFVSKKLLALSGAALVLWGYWAGQGGFFYQSPDYHFRNAVFRDLIFYNWPVLYAQQMSALVYYLGHWLVPAGVAKLFLFAGAPYEVIWAVGNICLLLWGVVGVMLLFLLMLYALNADTAKKAAVCLALLIFFSGMDAVGSAIFKNGLSWHIEWWADSYQYSSLTTCMFWVFNQTIEPWLIMMLLFLKPKTGDFAFLGLICLFFAPFPFVGLLPYFFVFAGIELHRAYKENRLKQALLGLFTRQNVLACAVIFPISALYYTTNTALSDSEHNAFVTLRFLVEPTYFEPYFLIKLACFMLLEFGFFLLLLHRDNKRNPYYLTAAACLLIIPLFQVGFSGDFVMRASIPSLFLLMLLSARYLLTADSKSLKYAVFSLCLGIGAVTPVIEFSRAGMAVAMSGHLNLTADSVKTLGIHIGTADLRNFVRLNAADTPFYKYVARLP